MIITMELSEVEKQKQVSCLLKVMVVNEYAIKITWADKKSCAICFWKGDWTVCKYEGDYPVGYFTITDSGNITAEDKLLLALIESIRDAQKKEIPDSWRDPYANTIVKVINVWVKNFGYVQSIEVLLPGRNSVVRQNGKIELSRKDW